jgi:hypothetical protein
MFRQIESGKGKRAEEILARPIRNQMQFSVSNNSVSNNSTKRETCNDLFA